MKIENKGIKLSGRTKLIIALIFLIAIFIFIPVRKIILDPSIIGYSIFDTTITRAYVSGQKIEHECQIILEDEWNLISIPCLADNTSIENVLSNISGKYYSVHAYYPNDRTDPWKAYNPYLPDWVIQDLKEINEQKGYWINMKNSSLFELSGYLIKPDRIQLAQGWNLIGYPTNVTKNISDALTTIDGSYTILWFYNASEMRYYYYNASSEDGTFLLMHPHYGYWIMMSKEDTLFII